MQSKTFGQAVWEKAFIVEDRFLTYMGMVFNPSVNAIVAERLAKLARQPGLRDQTHT